MTTESPATEQASRHTFRAIGMTQEQAQEWCVSKGYGFRVTGSTAPDGKFQPHVVTRDYRTDRINIHLDSKGRVRSASIG